MSIQSVNQTELKYRIAYWILVLLAVSTTVNSFVRAFLEPYPVWVAGCVAASLFAIVVLLIPFRKGEPWAWYAAWIFAALLAIVFVLGEEVGIYYLSAAVIVALCLLLTRPAFF
jgi:hypothetical protein